MSIQRPIFLFLLILLPYFAYLGWPGTGYGRKRQISALIIRLLLALVLILGLADFAIKKPNDQLAVVFLLDISDSVTTAQQTIAINTIESLLEDKPENDLAAVIVFGGNALVEHSLEERVEFYQVQSKPNASNTDIGEALQLAQALFPAASAKRIVLFSDGYNNQGDAVATARITNLSGIEIIPVHLQSQETVETAITNINIPSRLHEGEMFDLIFSVYANQATQALIRILHDGQVISEQTTQLEVGEHTYSVPIEANQTGLMDLQVEIVPLTDTYAQNNRQTAITMVSGPAKILVVAIEAGTPLPGGDLRPDEYSAFLKVLDESNIQYDRISPGQLPIEAALLADYNSVVLIDIPARQLLPQQMTTLQSYVRDLGGGLLVIGGPTSYGVGGYYKTPLEEMLPVEMQIKDETRRSTTTIVFVIDRSGSMSDTSGGIGKLELAKEAAARAVELLLPFDKVGVIVFDDSASWVVEITEVGDGVAIVDAIGTIRSGGGTDIFAGVQAVANVLPNDNSEAKHVILLTDGGADPTGIPEMVQKLYGEDGITLTTIGVGADAAPFLQDLATIGGGRYHYVTNPQSIPSIFTEETTLAMRSYLVEDSFTPSLNARSPILDNITTMPPLAGYVGTSPKLTGKTILVSHLGDPILSSWQYGLGKVVAFTSDSSGRWAQNWINWDQFPTFWGQTVSFINAPFENSLLSFEVTEQNGEYKLVGTLNSANSVELSQYQLSANMVDPDGDTQTFTMTQTGAGRFETDIPIDQPGGYFFGISGENSLNGEGFSQTFGWAQSYSAEYQPRQPYQNILPQIAALSPNAPAINDVFSHTLTATATLQPIWRQLLALASILLILDVAVRRLVIGKEDFIKSWNTIRSPFARPTQIELPVPVERMSALRAAKERTTPANNEESQSQPKPPTIIPPVGSQPSKSASSQTEVKKPSRADEQSATPLTTTSALLKNKRKRKEDNED